jgi:TPR repeat protein
MEFRASAASALLLALALGAAGCDRAHGEAQAAYDAGDHARAMDLWRPLAEGGDARAQYAIGYMFDTGQGLPAPDPAEAARWYRLAGDQGHVDAQYNLAILYHTERGDWPRDMRRATDWYMRAAEQGHPQAQYVLGRLYYLGNHLPKNLELAAMWLERCAASHDPKCLNLLGILTRDGRGVKQDVTRGLYLICQAAELGDPGGQGNLAWIYQTGGGATADPLEAARWRAIAARSNPDAGARRPELEPVLSEQERARIEELADAWQPAATPAEATERCARVLPD